MKASSLLLLLVAAATIPGCCSSSVAQASSTTAHHHQQGHDESSSTSVNSAALFRAEAAVHADAAILDQETGRVFWEGSSTLQASLAPKFRIIPHFRATILTLILWTSGLRYALDHRGEIGWFATSAVRRASERSPPSLVLTAGSRVAMIGLHLPRRLFSFLYRCIRCIAIPHVPKWLLLVTAVLYLWESWTCSTHQYLSNAVYDMEDRIQTIRQTDPTIQWTVRTFHYGGFHNLIKNVTGVSTQFYNYKSCRDRTFAGVWKRAVGIRQPRFVRATVTKIIVLSAKARRSYFQQQAAFLKAAGTDEFSEFSTRIGIPGCSRVLLQATTTAMSHHHDDGQGRSSGLYVWRLLYLFCTMITCSVPFRYWLSNCSNYVKITIVKELYDSSVNDERRDDFVWPKNLAEIR